MTAWYAPRYDPPGLMAVDLVMKPVILVCRDVYTVMDERAADILVQAAAMIPRWPSDALEIVRHGQSAIRALTVELLETWADTRDLTAPPTGEAVR